MIRKLSTRSIAVAVHRHGAEFARPRRAAASVRHQGAAGLLAAAACRRRRKFPASGSPARRRARMPRRCATTAWFAAAPGRAARCSASGSTGTSATSRWGRSRPCSGLPSSSTIPITCSASARRSASRLRWCRPICRASRSAAAICRRMQAFQNGPNYGRDVFIPMDHVIGGVEQVGKGWKMLMSALAAGRGISLPSLSAAACVVHRAHHRHVFARARAIQCADRPLRSDPGAARPHGRHRVSARGRAPA